MSFIIYLIIGCVLFTVKEFLKSAVSVYSIDSSIFLFYEIIRFLFGAYIVILYYILFSSVRSFIKGFAQEVRQSKQSKVITASNKELKDLAVDFKVNSSEKDSSEDLNVARQKLVAELKAISNMKSSDEGFGYPDTDNIWDNFKNM